VQGFAFDPYNDLQFLATSVAPPDVEEPAEILIAEDNAVNRKVLITILERAGYSVTVAEDGLQALERLKERRFDLALLDVQMPGYSGFEVVQFLREMETGMPYSTPAVALTAHAMKGDREKCLSAGMDEYLTKPIERKSLLEVMNRLLKRAPAETSEVKQA
jgi:osomolarity two-component system sensor histidine kinase NIK1